ncbi:MAG: DUF3288 family protein [Synechococcales bacterium]|nr:DUF3288 family protein [Synechococcales bacterium]
MIAIPFTSIIMPSEQRDQQHPLWNTDRQIVNSLLAGEPTELNLAELARLLIRYDGFPGARDIQADLLKVLQRWQISEEELMTRTRQLHATTKVYNVRGRNQQVEDWS